RNDLALPDTLVDPPVTPVEVVGAVVGGEGILLPLEPELPLGDAIRHPAHHAAEVGGVLEPVLELLEAQHDIGGLPVPVRDLELADDGPPADDLRLQTLLVG